MNHRILNLIQYGLEKHYWAKDEAALMFSQRRKKILDEIVIREFNESIQFSNVEEFNYTHRAENKIKDFSRISSSNLIYRNERRYKK